MRVKVLYSGLVLKKVSKTGEKAAILIKVSVSEGRKESRIQSV